MLDEPRSHRLKALGPERRAGSERWPWSIAVEPLLVVPDLDLAPPVEAIGVAAG